MDSQPLGKVDIDLWTIISLNGDTATMWFRIGDKLNEQILHALRPDLADLAPDDRQMAEDIANTLFPPLDALQFLAYLARHSDLGSEHRMASVHHPGCRAQHARLWEGMVMYELHVPEFYPGWITGVNLPNGSLTPETPELN